MDGKRIDRVAIGIAVGATILLAAAAGADSDEEPLRFPTLVIEPEAAPRQIQNYPEAGLVPLNPDALRGAPVASPAPERRGAAGIAMGRYNARVWHASHHGRSKGFTYDTRLLVEETGGERPRSGHILYQPHFAFQVPWEERRGILLECDYFDKQMELPGPATAPFPRATRHNVNARVALGFTGQRDDHTVRISPYAGYSRIDENANRPNHDNRHVGVELKMEGVTGLYALDIQHNRFSYAQHQGVYTAYAQLPDRGLSENWRIRVAAEVFSQDGFGCRLAPQMEFFYDYDEDRYHHLSVGRTVEAFAFGPAYRDDNFVEVRPERIRPRRDIQAMYAFHTRLSNQWRVRAAAYTEEIKDRWYWADDDGNGLYAPTLFSRARAQGVLLAAEYQRREHFGYFMTLNVRAVESRDRNAAVVPFEPKQRIAIGANWAFLPRWRLYLLGDFEGRRYARAASKESFKPYHIAQAKLTFSPKENLTFTVIVDNVFNDHYEIVSGYANQSRSASAGVTARF